MDQVKFSKTDQVIMVQIKGKLTEDILFDGIHEIQNLIAPDETVSVLFDLLEVDLTETREIALEVNQLEATIHSKIKRIAVVVPDYLVATRAGLAFVNTESYERFYDLESARQWLRS